MKNMICTKSKRRLLINVISFFGIFILTSYIANAQSLLVLPTDGSSSSEIAPQGSKKFQRQFYLMTQSEIQNAGLTNDKITSIGFTIGVPQNDTASASFKVYLENTTDTVCRLDTNYTVINNVSSSYIINSLTPGEYDFQLISDCGGSSSDTIQGLFSNFNLDGCNNPTHLAETAIGSSTVTFNWYAPVSAGIVNYQVDYRQFGIGSWISTNVTGTTLNISGLTPETYYEWRVKTLCTSSASEFVQSAFQTTPVIAACSSPVVPAGSVTSITNTGATLSWNSASGATYYGIRYRRVGTNSWVGSISFSNTYNVVGLTSGTSYEWEVRTVCNLGKGAYVSGSQFTTSGPVTCYAPEEVFVDSLTSTSVVLSWPATSGVTYTLRYRLKNSIDWVNAKAGMMLVHDNPIVIPKAAGEYDIPFSGTGNSFTYNGGGVYVAYEYAYLEPCYDVDILLLTDTFASETSWELVDSISNTVLLSGGGYLDDIWYVIDTSICVTNGTALKFVIYDSANDGICCGYGSGSYKVSVNGTTYANGGSFSSSETTYFHVPTSIMPSDNISMTTFGNKVLKNSYGQDSLKLPLSVGSIGDDGFSQKLIANNFRPETRFGNAVMVDSVEVTNVYALGHYAIPYNNSEPIRALITNKSLSDQVYPVTLTIKDQITNTVKYTVTKNKSVGAKSSDLIKFSTWTPTLLETDSIIVSVPNQPNENITGNNRNYYIQKVNSYISGYDDNSPQLTSAGFGTSGGLILSKHEMFGCGKINAAQIYLTYSAKNHNIRAVLLDVSGNIIDYSPAYIPDSTQVNRYHSFYFNSQPTIDNAVYYVGLEQKPNSVASNPVGVQWEGKNIRSDAYFRAPSAGGSVTEVPAPGRLMIKAEIMPAVPEVIIDGSDKLCTTSSTNTLNALISTSRFASSVLGFSSQYSSSQFNIESLSGSPDVYPGYGLDLGSWISASADGQREYVEVGFNNPGPVNFIDIYETLNPGAVDSVFLMDPGNGYQLVYSGTAAATATVGTKNRIYFPQTAYDVSKVKITLASDSIAGYNAIDAIGIGLIDSTNAAGASFAWNPGGATTQSINVSSTGTKTVTADFGGACASAANINITNFSAITPLISSNGPLSICKGDASVILTSSEEYNNHWTTGDTTRSITIDSSIVSSADYRVWVSNINGCTPDTSAPTHVQVNSNPNFNITGALGICPGDSTQLGVSGSFSNYNWSTMESTASIYVSTPGIVGVEVTDANGCKASKSAFTYLATPPSPIISGKLTFCQGSSTILSVRGGYLQYNWSTGQTTSSINATLAGTYTVTVTDVNGCTGSTSATTQYYPGANPVITGSTSICQNVPSNLDAGIGFQNYLWSTGQSSQIISVSTANTFTVSVTNSFGCTGSASVTTTLSNAIPADAGPISGDTVGVCNQTGLTYSIVPVANASYYQWTVPAQSTILSGQGTTSITVDFGSLSGVGFISVVATNSCGQSAVRTIQVNSAPSMPGMISGQNTNVCSQTGIVYSIAPVLGATTYTWTVPFGAVIVSGQTTNSIVVNYTTPIPGFITVRSNSPCGTSAPVALAITCANCTNPPFLSETHTNVTCFGAGDGAIDVTLTGGVPTISYLWSNGATTQDVSALGGGTYIVTVLDNQGCSDMLSINVAEPAQINANISTSDPTTFCPQVWALLEAVSNPGYTYQWYRFNNPIAGATSSTYEAKQSGPHTCVITTANGCSATSNVINTTRLDAPIAQINETSPFSICGSGPGVLTAVTGTGYSYEWLRYGNKAPGNNNDSIYYVSKNGNYKVRVTGANGCVSTSNKVNVVKNQLPRALVDNAGPISACIGDTVVLHAVVTKGSPPYIGYQWYRYNTLLVGETNDSLLVDSDGGYSVTVTDSKGCDDSSPRTVVTFGSCPRYIPFSEMNNGIYQLSAYPNPFDELITLSISTLSKEKIVVRIMDSMGKQVFVESLSSLDGGDIYTGNLAPGFYMLEVTQGSFVRQIKLIKAK